MPFISVTRLRIRKLRFLPGFAIHASRSQSQLRGAAGFQRGALLPDRRWTFWTLTAWDDLECMRAYMRSGAHKPAMAKLMHWCDEASVVHWNAEAPGLPDWTEAQPGCAATGARPSSTIQVRTMPGWCLRR